MLFEKAKKADNVNDNVNENDNDNVNDNDNDNVNDNDKTLSSPFSAKTEGVYSE